jgi:hypothetical protein
MRERMTIQSERGLRGSNATNADVTKYVYFVVVLKCLECAVQRDGMRVQGLRVSSAAG